MKTVTYVMTACLVLTAGPASAEWFADVYAGQGFTEKSDVTVHSSAGLGISRDVEFDRSLAYGGRFGRYFDGVPFLGFGVDLFSFSPRIGPQRVRVDGCVPSGSCNGGQGGTNQLDVDAYALSLDLILRAPLLKTEKAPWGSIQPYLPLHALFQGVLGSGDGSLSFGRGLLTVGAYLVALGTIAVVLTRRRDIT